MLKTVTKVNQVIEDDRPLDRIGWGFGVFRCQGISPLIVNNPDYKLVPNSSKKKMSPKQQMETALYYIDKDKKVYGFKAHAFKLAMVNAAPYIDDRKMSKNLAKGVFKVNTKRLPKSEFMDLIQIHTKQGPILGGDWTTNPTTGGQIKTHRPYFMDWYVDLPLKWIAKSITKHQVMEYLQHAGACVGVGDWRQQKSGNKGEFEIEDLGDEREII
jgi:hypothetical protein